ncbi:WhiB family transcriptional regulator [Williamsia sp. DF01-3]|uniref:WhiB family transcriptional regulator n=1 Tax=Williamsia sp. DF01-3 TaxID=2934157 RepID=UPI000DB6234D|nr:MAG: hypothetical protein DI630_15550 [Gordonia sp. (in: high G+C Gram-positive bacteria)]
MIYKENPTSPDFANAPCSGQSPLFDDHLRGETAADRAARLSVATRLCHDCPCRQPCDALRRTQHHPTGVWAGRIYLDRRRH